VCEEDPRGIGLETPMSLVIQAGRCGKHPDTLEADG
jgi:hypothetical protein